MSLLLSTFSPMVFAQTTSIFTYFSNSNLAGKFIIGALAFFSICAWAVMIGKFLELKKLRLYNLGFEQSLHRLSSVVNTPPGFSAPKRVPYAALYLDAVEAYHRVQAKDGESAEQLRAARIEHVENALQRTLANKTLSYESSMIFLATIVSGAPFFGLLGTVWGVMDAFGAVGLQATATLQNLAPGVSGALLTTVAGLCVAIPSVFGYNYLLSRTKILVTELENFASALADMIELESR
ncbi:MAG: MotA/TolQ/ExbB proton channel family protein [Verrucomicrobiota bacterium]